MTREDRKLLKAYDKEMKEKIELMHRIRSTPFCFHRVGKFVPMEKVTDKDIKEMKKHQKKLASVRRNKQK